MNEFNLNFYKGKKVLVTGHTGFKGTWLCRILQELGAEVTGYSQKPPTDPSIFTLTDLESQIHSVIGDIRDLEHMIQVFKETQPEIVFHLAAQPIVRESYKNPVNTYETNVMGTVNVLEAVRLRDAGAGYQESIDRLNEIKSSGRIFFTVGNMEYLKHGGRIGKVASVAGSLLGIKPIITLKEGEIFPSGIGRSRRKTVDKTIDLLLAYLAEEKTDIADYSICIGYGYDKEEAVEFRDRLVSRLKEKGYDIDTIPIFQIGATIGVHTGPYPLGIGVVKKSIRE